MSKYWSVIMWMYDTKGSGDDTILMYKPSGFHSRSVMQFDTYANALRFGLGRITRDQSSNINAMPTFIAKVVDGTTKPDIGMSSTLRLRVKRISLGRDRGE